MTIKRLEAQDAPLAVEVVMSFAAKDVSLEYMKRFLSNSANEFYKSTGA
jgi:hypothetical protein